MAELVKWFVEHPLWTFIGAVLGILGIITTIWGVLFKPIDPELVRLETLLNDISTQAIEVFRFANFSEDQIDSMLGGKEGWVVSSVKSINRVQSATDSLTNSSGYSRMSDHGRGVFSGNNSRLKQYENREFLLLRKHALKANVCGLIMNSVREIGILHKNSSIETCFPITHVCASELKEYALDIGVDFGECVSFQS